MPKQKVNFFWASYADLMTSLFFIMLVLFVITVVMMKKQAKATEDQLKKITEIQESVNKIDTTYFIYNKDYKKHILKINVEFANNSAQIKDIPIAIQNELIKAGNSLRDSINMVSKKMDAKYLLVIEGQASKDGYFRNYELSYQRALTLFRLWYINGVIFNKDFCEVIIAGSGQSGAFRINPDNAGNTANQRFLIHIIPKPGIFKSTNVSN